MLKEVRERQGLSQQELAKRIGIERARYSDLERGKISKWLIAAIRLNKFLAEAGYSLDDLILYLPDPEDRPKAAEAAGRYTAKGFANSAKTDS